MPEQDILGRHRHKAGNTCKIFIFRQFLQCRSNSFAVAHVQNARVKNTTAAQAFSGHQNGFNCAPADFQSQNIRH